MVLKVRKNRTAPPPEPCALEVCMAVIGGAWTPNIIWHLKEGPRRFGELRADMPVSAKVLTQRLKKLVSDGIVERTEQPTSPPSVDYRLTDLGAEMVPALEQIVSVGHRLKARAQDS